MLLEENVLSEENEENKEYKAGQAFGFKGESKALNNFINSPLFARSDCYEEEKINKFFYALMQSNRRFEINSECTEHMMIMFIAGYLSVVIPKRKKN